MGGPHVACCMSIIDKMVMSPCQIKKASSRPVNLKKVPCRPSDFKKVPCCMSLRPKKGRVAVLILGGLHP